MIELYILYARVASIGSSTLFYKLFNQIYNNNGIDLSNTIFISILKKIASALAIIS